MESFFGIGGAELVLILVLATVILGPLRMIRMARQFGILLRDLRNYYTQLTAGLSEELAVLAEAKEIVQEGIDAAAIKPEELQVTITDAATIKPEELQVTITDAPTDSAPESVSRVESPAPTPDASLAPEELPPTLSSSESVPTAMPESSSLAAVDVAQASAAKDESPASSVAPGNEGVALAQEAPSPVAEPPLISQDAAPGSDTLSAVDVPADQTASESAPAPEMMSVPENSPTPDGSQEPPPPPVLPERAVAVTADELGLL